LKEVSGARDEQLTGIQVGNIFDRVSSAAGALLASFAITPLLQRRVPSISSTQLEEKRIGIAIVAGWQALREALTEAICLGGTASHGSAYIRSE
jgi:hypothetical protein